MRLSVFANMLVVYMSVIHFKHLLTIEHTLSTSGHVIGTVILIYSSSVTHEHWIETGANENCVKKLNSYT